MSTLVVPTAQPLVLALNPLGSTKPGAFHFVFTGCIQVLGCEIAVLELL
jgi:hypothetical protein